jgi:phosphoribosylanthranilate isomerase
MSRINVPFIQIAGIRSRAEAELLLECGAEYLGFPLRLEIPREDLSEKKAKRLIRRITSPVQPVLITYLDKAQEILAFCMEMGVDIVQLHGPVPDEELKKVKSGKPALTVIKSLIVKENNLDELLDQVSRQSAFADAFILDSYDPENRASGATGKTHNWGISRRIVEASPKHVILAGGLTPENVALAIHKVRPQGVDAHTGVEDSTGAKDRDLAAAFVDRALEAFAREGIMGPQAVHEMPIDGVLDLHAFSPREVKDLVPEYLEECRSRGLYSVRIIHGKGTGTLRRIVRSLLEKNPHVLEFRTADSGGGSWGATEVSLRRKNPS